MNTEIKLDKNGLPSIINIIPDRAHRGVRFILPVVGHDLVDQFPQPEMERGAAASTMSIRLLSLEGDYAVPFHKNPERDKYLRVTQGSAIIYSFDGTTVTEKHLYVGGSTLIKAGIGHALYTRGQRNEILIISAPVVSDVVWEDGAAALTENRHLETA